MTASCGHLDIPPGDPVADQLGLGAVALRYAQLGLAVFPLVPGGKAPAIPSAHPPGDPARATCHGECGRLGHGFYDATTDPAVITGPDFWGGSKALGIGIRPDGYLVIDLDLKSADGPAVFGAWLAERGLEVPQVPYVTTPSGGSHLWLRLPPGVTVQSRNGVLPSVDVKADGGYVVAPPTRIRFAPFRSSTNPRGTGPPGFIPYSWSGCPCQAPLAPAALLDALSQLHGSSSGNGGGSGGGEWSGLPELPAIEVLMERGADHPHDVNMARLAARLAAQGSSWEQAYPVLRAVADRTAETYPWSDSNLQGKFSSAQQKGYGTVAEIGQGGTWWAQTATSSAAPAAAWHMDPATGQAVPGRRPCRCGRELAQGGRCPRCIMAPDACMCPSLSEIGAKMRPGSVVLDEPAIPSALWGKGSQVLASFGESTLIVGDDGTGKTTLAQALIRAQIGIGPPDVLGFPVAPLPARKRVLYLAMDRPHQAKRSMARTVSPADRAVLDERLVVWEGPPPADLARDPSMLSDMCRMAGAGSCYVDSLKDAALGLSEDAVGSAWNRARQLAIAAGTQMIELHHPRKATGDNPKPKSLQDVYGSRWITAGAGSVVFLWGKAGDPVIELIHLKQPAEEVTGLSMVIDAEAGTVSAEGGDVVAALAAQGVTLITAALAAQLLYRTPVPDRNQVEKARRALKRLEDQGALAAEHPGGRGSGHAASWRVAKEPPPGAAGGDRVDYLWSVLWDNSDHNAKLDDDEDF